MPVINEASIDIGILGSLKPSKASSFFKLKIFPEGTSYSNGKRANWITSSWPIERPVASTSKTTPFFISPAFFF